MSTWTGRPWLDTSLTAVERTDLLLPRLDLDQKMAQISCYFPVDIANTSEFDVRYPHGVGEVSCLEARAAGTLDEVAAFQERVQLGAMAASGFGIPAIFHMEGLCGAFLPGATSFPSGIARASSWDVELEEQVAEIVGRQERALGITHTLAPVLDIARDPRMGRYGESYGEDPTLAAALGVAYTRGLQREDRHGRRTEGVGKHFLGSHHSEGGIHGAHADIPDRLLLEVYGTPFQAAIALGGLRGMMPCYNSVSGEPASSSTRLLTTLLRQDMGFDGLVVSDYGAVGNLHTVQRVAESFAGAGLAALHAGVDVELHVPQGFDRELRDRFAEGSADVAMLDRAVHRVLAAKFRMGLFEHPFALEGAERESTYHRQEDRAVTLRSARESLVLLSNDGVLPLAPAIRTIVVIGCHAETARFFFGGYTHYSMAEGKLAANASMAGLVTHNEEVRTATQSVPGTSIEASDGSQYEVLLQRQQPGIRSLLQELQARLPDTEVLWARGYPIAGDDESGHAEALDLAARADVVLMTLGGKHGTSSIASMGEGIDATDIRLPPCQEQLIIKLSALEAPVVGIHLDGRPVSSDAADSHLAALLEAWSPAESGAEAIVDVLIGATEPTGRLPVSVAHNAGQIPIYYNHPGGSAWHQGGSIGFADYVDAPHSPRYPFGHGLSYTRFEYSDLTLSDRAIEPDDVLQIGVTVRNTGHRTGTEVVQLYVTDRFASVSRPVRQLAGFRRVTLEAGAHAVVEFGFQVSQLAFVDRDLQWRVEAGDIDVMVGASSEDVRVADTFAVTSDAIIDGAGRGFFA